MDTPVKAKPKMKLYGFNNLTKTLSFNIYDICYTRTEEEKKQYIQYIDEVYNADRLTAILTEVSHIIGANILNVAKQDYDPQGASVTILISEEEIEKEDVVMHLDKSHLYIPILKAIRTKGLVHSVQTLKCPHVVKSLHLKHLTI